MQSHLILNLVTAVTNGISAGHLPHFCSWPIQYAVANLITLPEGQILTQSYSHHLVHIDLFEYVLNKEITINFAKTNMSIFMFAMFEGHSALYDQKDNFISEVKDGSCHFGYHDEGNYHVKLNSGVHKFLLLTFRPDWFLHETKNLHQFKTLITNYAAKKECVFALPYCRLTKKINQTLKKMLLQKKINPDGLYMIIKNVLADLMGQYHKMLVDRNYTTATLHQAKATDIVNFIQDNFKDQVVDRISELPNHFGVSPTVFQRMAKIAFGKPFQKQVTTLRMEYALQLLTTTNKLICEIALLAGYNDPDYFSRAFKKYYKVNPSSIREQHI